MVSVDASVDVRKKRMNVGVQVTHIERERVVGRYSIERVFDVVRAALGPKIDVKVMQVPCVGVKLHRLLTGLFTASSLKGDVFHIVGDVHYAAMSLPADRTIVTVHDLASLERLTGFRRIGYRGVYFDMPLRHCRAITVISEETRRELISAFPWTSDRVRVIPNPLTVSLRSRTKSENKSCWSVLIVGTGSNKNIQRACAALAGLPCDVTIIGQITSYVAEAVANNGIKARYLSNLSNEEIEAEYGRSDILLFPSMKEGFGLPVIEAQASGVVVVTSDIEPMRSISGGAAQLVNPFITDSIRCGVLEVMLDDKRRAALINAGYCNASRYCAKSVADQYAKLYCEIAGGRS